MSVLGQKAEVTCLESDVCITPESRHHPMRQLLHLITPRMWQGLLVLKHRAKIAHVEPSATEFAFPKMFGLGHGGSPVTLPMIFPRGIFGVMFAILVIHPPHRA
jgi:hypothetical protein